jgi:Spy/CpxP family protein refolding chaperone
VNAASAAQPADRAAFQRLHDLLTPEQRGQLADAIKAQVHSRMGEHAEHADHHGKGGHLGMWAAELKLTDDQQAQIKAALHDQFEQSGEHHGMHDLHQAHMKGKEMLDAFKADNFTLPPAEDVHAHAGAMADHFAKVAAAVLPILTPEQRTLAAQKLREKATSGDEAPMGE